MLIHHIPVAQNIIAIILMVRLIIGLSFLDLKVNSMVGCFTLTSPVCG